MGRVSQLLVNQLKRGEKKISRVFLFGSFDQTEKNPSFIKTKSSNYFDKKTKRQIEPKTNMLLFSTEIFDCYRYFFELELFVAKAL